MPRSARSLRSRSFNEGDAEPGTVPHRGEFMVAFEDASSGEEVTRRRRPKQRPMERKPTRKQLRAVAPGGLLIEDVFQRIGFDDGLPDVGSFDVLVDRASPGQQKWCSSFCWTGSCRFGNECKYSHCGCQLRIWKPAATLTPLRDVGIAPMEKERLCSIRANSSDLRAVVFLVFAGQVVWGRDLGASNAEIWSLFVHGWRQPQLHPIVDRTIANTAPCAEKATVHVSDWAQLPEVVWVRVAQATAVEDLAAIVASLPFVDWQDIVDSYWPNKYYSVAVVPKKCSSSRSASIQLVRQLISLCAASRTVSQVLRWPSIQNGTESTCAAGTIASSPSSPIANLMQSPAAGSPSFPSGRVDYNAGTSIGYVCPAVHDLLTAAGDPVNIPLDAAVLTGGVCMDDSLVVIHCRGGCFRAIRRSDLKQVCGLSVREANCFDFQGELLVVGTSAPARLVAYDLSVPKPSKPSYQLRMDGGAHIDVARIIFVDASRFVCGLQVEDRAVLDNAVIVSCEDSGFVPSTVRLSTEGLASLNANYVTMVSTGTLSVWDFSSDTPTDLQITRALDMTAQPILPTGSSAQFVAVGGSGGFIAVFDLLKPSDDSFVFEMVGHLADAMEDHSTGAGAELSGLNDGHVIHWICRDVHVYDSVLMVVAEPSGGEYTLEAALSAEVSGGVDSLFLSAWHLPTHRILLSNQALRGHISAFSRSNSISTGGGFAFAVSQPVGREGRIAHHVVLPGSSATKVRTGRSTGFTGPQRHKISGSDLRARRSGGMRRR